MKAQRLILALLALTFALASQLPGTASAQADKKKYGAKLISPRAGQVLTPGQVVRIEWTADFPDVDLTMCETEILLSLDGGRTIYMMLTEQRNPTVHYFDWTVPKYAAHQRSGAGHSLRVSESLPGNVKPSGSIRFCDQSRGELIFIFFGALPGDEATAVHCPQS